MTAPRVIDAPRQTWTVAEAAQVLGISSETYRRKAKAGLLPVRSIGDYPGARLVVPKIQLDAYLAGTWASGAAS